VCPAAVTPLEGLSKRFTQEFEAYAVILMSEMPVKRADRILGESDKRIWRMFFIHLKAAHARLNFDTFATPSKVAMVWVAFAEELLQHIRYSEGIKGLIIDISAT
jgi:hypothetical protein